MVKKYNYLELLNDPKWIRKSKQVKKHDNYKCTACGSKNNLEIHHTYYVTGEKPWEYPTKSLLILCESCHKNYHINFEIEVRKKIIKKQEKILPSRIQKTNKKKSRKVKFIPIQERIAEEMKKYTKNQEIDQD